MPLFQECMGAQMPVQTVTGFKKETLSSPETQAEANQ
jgi:hypothetical protein